jgi:hypothetical protein
MDLEAEQLAHVFASSSLRRGTLLYEEQEPEGNMTMAGKTRRWLMGGIVGLFILCVILGAFATYYVWYTHIPIYSWLLSSVLPPPGLLPESVSTTLEVYHPCGSKSYDVDNEHVPITDFFVSELPRVGWELVEHKDRSSKISSNKHVKVDELIFVNRQQYWLGVNVHTWVETEGVRIGNSWVHLTVCRNAERYYVVGSPESE